MDLNSTWFGAGILVFILVIGILSYILGKRKTTTPKMTTVIGVVLSVVPPLGLIFIIILFFTKDLQKE